MYKDVQKLPKLTKILINVHPEICANWDGLYPEEK